MKLPADGKKRPCFVCGKMSDFYLNVSTESGDPPEFRVGYCKKHIARQAPHLKEKI